MSKQKGFTLIELLVVIAILGILAAILVLAINPAETQRRSRDTQRLSDLATVRKAIDISVADGGVIPGTALANYSADSTGTRATADPLNWVGMDVSKYLSILPIDPRQNATDVTLLSDGSTQIAAGGMIYTYQADGAYYELNVYMESVSNAAVAANDGGTNPLVYEIGTDPGLDLINP